MKTNLQILPLFLLLAVCFALPQSCFAQVPANNDCSGAIALTVNSGSTCTTTTTGTSVGATQSQAGCTGTADDDVWYKFTATAVNHKVAVSAGTMSNIVLQIFSGTCGSLTSMYCVNATSGASSETCNLTCLSIGTTYYLRVYSQANSSGKGTFTICVSTPVLPNNDNCACAIGLTVNADLNCGVTSSGTTVSATQSQAACAGTADDDVWYTFTATATSHKITVTPGTLSDAVFQVFSGNCSALSSINCTDATSGSSIETATLTGLTIGNTYYVRVHSFASGSGQGTFTICVGTPPPVPVNDNCATAVTITVGAAASGTTIGATQSMSSCNSGSSDDDVWYTFTATAQQLTITVNPSGLTPIDDPVIEILSGSCGTLTSYGCINGNGSGALEQTTSNCLSIGTIYYIRVFSFGNATGNGTFEISVTTGNPINNEYSLMDDASNSVPYGTVRLTPNALNQRGCAWDINSTLDFSVNFSYDFIVNLGSNDGGADGIAFVIQNDPRGRCSCGTTGSAIGAGGITNSLIIEIDTYLNTEDRDDGLPGVLCSGGSGPDHLDLWTNGNVNPAGAACPGTPGTRIIPAAIPLLNNGVDYDVENGLDHVFRVSWNASTNTITAKLMDANATITYGTLSYSFTPAAIFGTSSPFFGVTASTGGLSNNQSFRLPGVLLPLDLLSFNAAIKSSHEVNLKWQTAREKNIKEYVLLKRTDLESNFYPIAQSYTSNAGAGTYQQLDQHPSPGNNYYQLQIIEQDGSIHYSHIIAIDYKDENKPLSIYPNPSRNWIQLKTDDQSGFTIKDLHYEIKNSVGTTLLSGTVDPVHPLIDVTNLNSGCYYMVAAGAETGNTVLKLVKE